MATVPDTLATIWITRTQPGAGELARRLDAAGYNTLVWPLIEIELLSGGGSAAHLQVRVNDELTDANTALTRPPRLVIAVSGHAVAGFLKNGLHQEFQSVKYIAVGESTGDLLGAAGLDVVVPGTATSEGILALPEITRLQPGERVWLLAGEGGRNLLERQLLSQYGVSVVKLELYRRVTRSQPPPVDAQTIGTVVLASQQAVEAFTPLWRNMGGREGVSIIAPSQRVADAAVRAGFTHVHSAHGAGAEAVLTAIEKIAGESR